MSEFQCKYINEFGCNESWPGELEILTTKSEFLEVFIRGCDSAFRIVIGKCSTGNYMCIPSVGVGCELSDLSDLFWNTQRISEVMNIIDAVTIASALCNCPTF